MQLSTVPAWMLAAGFALLCQNCSKENSVISDQDGTMDISASVEVRSKTELGALNAVIWSESDAVSVLGVNSMPGNGRFELSCGAGTGAASFTGQEFETAGGYYAVYPYNVNCCLSDDMVSIPWSGGIQTATQSGFDPASATLLGYSTSGSVEFKNVVSYIKFTIDFPCSQVSFESNGGETVNASAFKVKTDAHGLPVICQTTAPTTGSSSKVVLKPASGRLQPGTYLMAVLPAYLNSGFIIRFKTSTDDAKSFKYTSKSVELKRGNILNLGTISATDLSGWWLGDGTQEYPYLIASAAQLKNLADWMGVDNYTDFDSKYYMLAHDIDYGGNDLSIGGQNPFKGNFDGGGHTIVNVRPGAWSSGSCTYRAIFPRLYNATVKNLNVRYGNTADEWLNLDHSVLYMGGLVGYAYTSSDKYNVVEGCSFTIDRLLTVQNFGTMLWGGMVAYNGGNLHCNSCSANVQVRLFAYSDYKTASLHVAGGMVGQSQAASNFEPRLFMDRCRTYGKIDVSQIRYSEAFSGGMVGYVYEAGGIENSRLKMTNCVNYAEIGASNVYEGKNMACAGGLVGKHDSDGSYGEDPYIYNSLNKGKVSVFGYDCYAGGIMGWCYDNDTKVNNCANVGTIEDGLHIADSSKNGHTAQNCGNGNGDYTNFCGAGVKSSAMNSGKSSIPSSNKSYLSWTGDGPDIDLVF